MSKSYYIHSRAAIISSYESIYIFDIMLEIKDKETSSLEALQIINNEKS